MRKIALVLIIGFLATGAAFAQNSDDEVGIGFLGNFGGGGFGGDTGGIIQTGLSLKLPDIPIFWGLTFNFYPGAGGIWGMGLKGDYHFFRRTFRDEIVADDEGYTYHLRLDWYIGLGGFTDFLFGGDNMGFAFGFRVPAGISWRIVRWAELAVGVVPSFGMYAGPGGPTVFWSVGGELALRYWFTPQARRQNRNGNRNGEPVREAQNAELNGVNGANGFEYGETNNGDSA
ncbi:MAG: hypothetical protein FWB79_05220 [Treponema sp.]|nr:hypothetical protein [Treponema sp.]